MHDKPGVLKLDVTSATFESDLQAALEENYALFCVSLNFVVLKRGY